MRIGHGFDAHRFSEGDSIVLGGIKIPHTHGIEAHSDGDVILHALCDALLGAMALGDIGHFYPPDDMRYKNMDSRVFLKDVYEKICAHHYVLGNADITVIAQVPKLSPFREKMRESIATDLSVERDKISIKATTTEGMGFTGRKEGIAVHAVVLLISKLPPL